MTPNQIDLVQNSFAKIVPIADRAAEIFYEQLFELAPDLRPMFASDMTDQRKKLVAALGLAVGSLRSFEAVEPKLKALGRRHAVNYGVLPQHYEIVGTALLKTLEIGLGDGWDAETQAAWRETYRCVSVTMQTGSESLLWVA